MSLLLEVDTNPALANPKLRAVLQHGCSHALFVVKRAVGGIKILQVDDFVPHFQQAMVPRNLRVTQRDVSALPSDHDARFRQSKKLAVRGPRRDRKEKYNIHWQLHSIVFGWKMQI